MSVAPCLLFATETTVATGGGRLYGADALWGRARYFRGEIHGARQEETVVGRGAAGGHAGAGRRARDLRVARAVARRAPDRAVAGRRARGQDRARPGHGWLRGGSGGG